MTTVAFAATLNLKLTGVASRGPPSHAYYVRHMTISLTITKRFQNMGSCPGTSSFCPFGKVLRVLLAQIVLGSDYSGSVKELRRLLQPVLRNVSLKKSLKNRKEEQNDLWTVFW